MVIMLILILLKMMMMTVLLIIVLCWDDVHGRCGNGNADVCDLIARGLVPWFVELQLSYLVILKRLMILLMVTLVMMMMTLLMTTLTMAMVLLLPQRQVGQASDASPVGRNDDGDDIADDHVESGHGGHVDQPI